MKYDFLIIGTGFFGSICARELTDYGYKCLIIDLRNHIGGNCYTENLDGINIHKYGPHIFNTSNKKIWDYINKYAEFNSFIYSPKANFNGKLYSLPFNMNTYYELWGIKEPTKAKKYIQKITEKYKKDKYNNLEEFALSSVGEEIYEKFIFGYTKKQWGKDPKELPSSIIKRIPLRFTFDNNYYYSKYQGIPIGGYTKIFEKLLKDIDIKLNCNYFQNKYDLDKMAKAIIFTGPIDQYFDYCYGKLEYRGLEFETSLTSGDFQGIAGVNYTDLHTPFTRIIEHKHFEFIESDISYITKEYPKKYISNLDIPYYPINTIENQIIYNKYNDLCKSIYPKVIFGGRLGSYKYQDMHVVIANALNLVENLKGEKNENSI